MSSVLRASLVSALVFVACSSSSTSPGGTSPDARGPDPGECGQALTADGVLDLDLPVVHITGRVTMDGAALPAGGAARLRLVRADSNSGDLGTFVDLGTVRGDGGSYDVHLLRGHWKILYDNTSCSDARWPCQTSAVVVADAGLTADGVYDIDLATAHVTGRLTMNGAALPSASYSRGRVMLTGDDGSIGTFVPLDSESTTYDHHVLVGHYALLYDNTASGCTGEPYPCQQMTRFRTGVSLTADGVLDVDLPTAHVTGRITVSGGAIPSATYARGLLRVRGAGDLAGSGSIGKLADLDVSASGTYSTHVIKARYDLTYDNLDSACTGTPLPCQLAAVVKTSVDLENDGALDVDVPLARLTGRLTLGGAALPTASYTRGLVHLHGDDESLGVLVNLDKVTGGMYSATVVRGAYSLSYDNGDSGCTGMPYPCQLAATFRTGLHLDADGALDVDIPIASISGNVTLDGGALPGASFSKGKLRVRGGDGSLGTLANLDKGAAYTARVVTGDYEVLYDNQDSSCTGDVYPCQQLAYLRDLTAQSDGVLDVDVATAHVSGKITQNGAALPAGSSRGAMRITGPKGSRGTLVNLDKQTGNNYAARVVPASYDITYEPILGVCDGSSLPCQLGTIKGCNAL